MQPGLDAASSVTITWDRKEVRVLTGDVALLTGWARTTITPKFGAVSSEPVIHTMLYARDPTGRWRLVNSHRSVLR